MILKLYILALRKMKFTIQDKMLYLLKINEFYEFETNEEYRKFSENLINTGEEALEFLNNSDVLLMPEIDERIKHIKTAFGEAVKMSKRYNELESFDPLNGGKVEDMLMDIYHCFDVIQSLFIE